ncbi:hypothetical protein [Streptomyces sp. NPDC048340]|uniref:hypothetical protein n=1 Tax=Streptomyces sp. NPDC048340 TaxID=3365537 RepID=UPI0037184CC6
MEERSTRRFAAAFMGLLSLVALVAGCSAAEPDEPVLEQPEILSAAQVCGGTLFTPEAASALGRVLQSSDFIVRDEEKNQSAAAMARTMEDAYRAGSEVRNMPTGNCDISGMAQQIDGDGHYPSAQVWFTAFSKKAGIPEDEPGGSDSGVMVAGAVRQWNIAFDCVSPRVGSTADIPLRITATFRNQFDKGNGDETELVGDYKILAHSAALSVAKELRCVDDGGLPGRAEGLPRA